MEYLGHTEKDIGSLFKIPTYTGRCPVFYLISLLLPYNGTFKMFSYFTYMWLKQDIFQQS